MGQYTVSGIKVLDRAVSIITSVAEHPRSLSELSKETGLPRASAHRIATALEVHGLLTRGTDGRFELGRCLHSSQLLTEAALPIMERLIQETGESSQLYELRGLNRLCVASVAPDAGLQNIVPTGTQLPLNAGSAAKIFIAFGAAPMPADAAFSTTELADIRNRGWADSVSEREVGLASVSAPIYGRNGKLLAVLSLSGLADRLKPSPGVKWGETIKKAAAKLSNNQLPG
ncbi:IclR family transcriptional regulator [Corynebacterium caspium]|uniref:IclR family transcriptional regulator n=1 Tax=Corynebacterium caspium TaxID=234828 RepID=UPI0003758E2C|nr:IclR family transcriptional regulator [Corynebacterium caspium]WKD59404.1 HTH-type transcriptional regulator KipR [Corynebacterium caspium DSM 44850]